jgi:hypothetical protein
VADQPHSLTSYPAPRIRQVEDLVHGVRRDLDELRRHPSNDSVLDLIKKIEASFEVVEDVVRSLRQDFTHHLDLHGGLDSSEEEPDGVLTGPTGDGQSDLDMIKWSQQLRTAYRTFMRYAADPSVPKQQFDLEVFEFRERVFELTKWMRSALRSQGDQGAQAT